MEAAVLLAAGAFALAFASEHVHIIVILIIDSIVANLLISRTHGRARSRTAARVRWRVLRRRHVVVTVVRHAYESSERMPEGGSASDA